MDGRDLDGAREARARAADERRDDEEPSHGQAVEQRGAHVASHHARGEAEGRAVHEDPGHDAREEVLYVLGDAVFVGRGHGLVIIGAIGPGGGVGIGGAVGLHAILYDGGPMTLA